MRTVILGERPVEIERLIAHRQATGADTHDELWEGVYHMAPAPNSRHGRLAHRLLSVLALHAGSSRLDPLTEFNLGEPDDFRVPDGGLLRAGTADASFQPTAALVVEVVSPGDESWAKLPFYAAHGVDEVIVADTADRTLAWFALGDGTYRRVDHSDLLDVAVADLHAAIDWPPDDDPPSGGSDPMA